ncbi:MAG: EF-hand domain-containing protein [Planctomycetes bacterium]|nr:EF-hand domain-containing protein [Planctomycetota bacterium]
MFRPLTLYIAIFTSMLIFIISGCGKDNSVAPKNHRQILAMMGAKGTEAASEQDIQQYKNIFGRMDADGDGQLTEEQYVKNSRHMNEMVRRKIFAATDRNKDGIATEAEYVNNRIITDEAKSIYEQMDKNNDGKLTKDEFKAKDVFDEFDMNADGMLTLPEYLRVWGNWARE